MRQVFKALLLLYPKSFRKDFCQEMLATFECVHAEHRVGLVCRFLFIARELAGLIGGICSEHVRFGRWPYRAGLVAASPSLPSRLGEIADLEGRIQFHALQAIDCIATHKFEGARFHAAEEERIRARLRMLRAVDSSDGSGCQE